MPAHVQTLKQRNSERNEFFTQVTADTISYNEQCYVKFNLDT